MKKLTILFTMLVCIVFSANAKQRNDSQMLAEANRVLGTLTSKKQGMLKSTNTPEILRRDSQFSIIGYNDGGFAVIANDDRFAAVLGYSDSKFDESNLPPAMIWWMEMVNTSLDKALASGAEPEMASPTDFGYPEAVESMVTTKWDQGTPYNNKCPTYTSGTTTQHYVTGCVATAMSQVMKYHNYPAQGKAITVSYLFYPDGTSGTGVTARAYLGVTYDWTNMIDNYGETSYTDVQANAVATLMLNNGVAVNMKYSKSGSSSTNSNAAAALKTYFSYSTKYMYREIYSTKEWMNCLFKELSDGFPLMYGGTSNSGGHSFVLDGYDANGLVHVNWGWGGSGDGYFEIASLNGYKTEQDMTRIHPLDKEENEIPYSSSWGMLKPFTATIDSDKKVKIGCDDFLNSDAEPFTGALGLGVISLSENNSTAYTIKSVSDIKHFYGYSSFYAIIDVSSFSDGEYILSLITKSENETSWQFVRSADDVTNSLKMTINGDEITFAPIASDWFVTTGILDKVISDNVISSADDGITRVYNAQGQLVYTSKTENFDINNVATKGMLIIKQGKNVMKQMAK
ncbi:MAG: C10 family peptidase [Prevotella sp.]